RVAVCDQFEDVAHPARKEGERGRAGEGETRRESDNISPSPALPLSPSPPAKGTKPGLVRREVIRIVTPGTVTEDNLLDPRQSNYLAAVALRGSVLGLAWVELTTGHFQAADIAWQQLADELGRLAPAECLCAESDPARLLERLRETAPN